MSLTAVPSDRLFPGDLPIQELLPWEYDHACAVGAARTGANAGAQDRDYYTNGLKEADLIADIAGAIAEMAVAKHLGLFWSGTVWPKGHHGKYRLLPDVEPNIEVRRIRQYKTTLHAVIRPGDLGRGLRVVAAFPVPPNFRRVQILGWVDADEGFRDGVEWKHGQRGVRVENLNPIETLKDQCRHA